MPTSSSLNCVSFDENYRIEALLGQGSFAKVYKCIEIAGSENVVAVKEIPQPANQEEEEQVLNEIEICTVLDHANIVSMYRAFLDEEGRRFLVMEFVNGKSLFDEIVRQTLYSEDEAGCIIKQLLYALDYLHQKRIVHRDVKPDNILLIQGADPVTIKLADFGLARRLPRDLDVINCDASGTPLFIAPETILEEPLGPPVDMWACGVLLFLLLVGYPPFWSDNDEQLLLSILRGRFSLPSPYWDSISLSAKDLVMKLILLQPCERLTSSGALRHPWITKNTLESAGSEFIKERKKRLNFPAAINGIRAMLKFRRMKLESGLGRRLSESGVTE